MVVKVKLNVSCYTINDYLGILVFFLICFRRESDRHEQNLFLYRWVIYMRTKFKIFVSH